VKWGLAGAVGIPWRARLIEQVQRLPSATTGVVAAYADAGRAGGAPLDEVADFACSQPWPGCVLLMDTFDKTEGKRGQRRTLLDWLSLTRLGELCQRCRQAGIRIALAGSLGLEELRCLRPLRPDWLAVRGAACERHDRRRGISAERVRA